MIASLLAAPLYALAQDSDGEELAELLVRIETVEKELKQDLQARDKAQADLRDAETEIMQLREATAQVEQKLESRRERQARLEGELTQSGEEHLEGQGALATAMRVAWRSGRQDNLKAILSGESSGEVGRRLVWTEMLVRSWAKQAGESARVAGEVRELRGESSSVAQELTALRAQRVEQIRNLEQAAARRRQTLEELQLRIGEAGEEMQRLKSHAATLTSLVENLGRILEDHPSLPLPSIVAARGQLLWPVSGRILQPFGAGPGGGQASWDGVLLEAEEGAPVRAPHPGRVVFADWVRGLGFLMVLDHGENVLSLYAYNERLVGGKGEMVNKGQVIAHAGSSGGRREPGLYFEMRHNGKPVDPVQWLSK